MAAEAAYAPAVAVHVNTSPTTLAYMASRYQHDLVVIEGIAGHPHTHPDILHTLATTALNTYNPHTSRTSLLYALVRNPAIYTMTLLNIVNRPDVANLPNIEAAALGNPRPPLAALLTMYSPTSPHTARHGWHSLRRDAAFITSQKARVDRIVVPAANVTVLATVLDPSTPAATISTILRQLADPSSPLGAGNPIHDTLYYLLAMHPHTTSRQLTDITAATVHNPPTNTDPQFVAAIAAVIAAHDNTSHTVLSALEHGPHQHARALASHRIQNTNPPPAVFDSYHAGTPAEALDDLALDPDLGLAIALHPNTAPTTLTRLWHAHGRGTDRQTPSAVHEALAAHQHAPAQLLHTLATTHRGLCSIIVNNPNAEASVLATIATATSDDDQYQYELRCHPNTSTELLHNLLTGMDIHLFDRSCKNAWRTLLNRHITTYLTTQRHVHGC